ncbi:uncharacterized protein L203_102833 [Cryptococcus depauperatus CBS 7841]|uniref:Translocation protein SEC62 n=1 Tax=Cryptococcus depauperatus CBS 7841 TaxID=1295531 RepID=A0A1E3IDD5_9TREE|nr:translocation protein SEC62 [Cryptococcus depauperatus CBS 7841]
MQAVGENLTTVVDAQKRAPSDIKNVVDFLRGKAGPKVRLGILNGKRVEYFKGKTAIRCLLSLQYQKLKKVPIVKDEDEAKDLLVKILPFAFFLRTDRLSEPPTPSGQPKPLRLAPQQAFEPLTYYTWFYDGSPLYTYLGAAAMVVVMLAGVMFPLWPVKLRIGVWYLSVGVLGLVGAFIGLAIVRLIIWLVTVVSMKRAIWIFPNLFEDVGFVDSFIPGWEWDEPKSKKKKRNTKSIKLAKSSESQILGSGDQGAAIEEIADSAGIMGGTPLGDRSETEEAVREDAAATESDDKANTGAEASIRKRVVTVEDAEDME